MRYSVQLSFGGFLLGLGLGWVIFRAFNISGNLFAWLIIIAGAGVVISALISWRLPRLPIGGLAGALLGGLVLSLFITSGFGFLGPYVGPYRAEGTRTFDGDVAADMAYFEVENRNGAIYVTTWDNSAYKVELTIKAKGPTDDEAERTIEGLDIDLREQVSQGQLRLVLDYNIPSQTWRKLSIEVTVVLPADAEIDLDLESSNGGIYLSGIDGDTINIHTSNGALDLDKVFAKSIIGTTSNGQILGEIQADNTSLTTSNGKIELTLPCTASSEYDLSTSNGKIELTVSPSAQVGYDLDLSTSNGDINLNLSGLDYTKNEKTNKEAKTTGFASRAIQIIIEADTSNGDINIDTTS